jgi:hypothetical protein
MPCSNLKTDQRLRSAPPVRAALLKCGLRMLWVNGPIARYAPFDVRSVSVWKRSRLTIASFAVSPAHLTGPMLVGDLFPGFEPL